MWEKAGLQGIPAASSSSPVTPDHPAFSRNLSISNFKMSELILASDRSRNIGQDFLLFHKREVFLSEQPYSWLRLEFTSLHSMTFLWVYWLIQGIWGHTELKGDTSVRCTKFRRRGGIQASLFWAAKNKDCAIQVPTQPGSSSSRGPVAVAQKYQWWTHCLHFTSAAPPVEDTRVPKEAFMIPAPTGMAKQPVSV